MGQHRIGVRVSLSPAAERRFLQACKVQGGQTRFVEEAIEFYVKQLDLMEKLDEISQKISRIEAAISGSNFSAGPAASQSPQEQLQDQTEKNIMDPVQFEAAVSTLRSFTGGDDF